MTFLSFRAALVRRELDMLTLSVRPRGCFVDFDVEQYDGAPYFRVRPGERVHVTGPDVFDDHALGIVVEPEPLVLRLVAGCISTVRGVTKVMGRRRSRKKIETARAA